MIRRLSKITCAVSLLICVATCVLWVRSYWTADGMKISSASYPYVGIVPDIGDEPMYKARIVDVTVGFNRGAVDVDVERSADVYLDADNLKDWREYSHRDGTFVRCTHRAAWRPVGRFPFSNSRDDRVLFDDLGVFVGSYAIDGLMAGVVDYTGHVVSIPAWTLALLAAILPALRLRARLRAMRRTRRLQMARCPTCGYDLRASTDRCPECGTPIAAKS